MWTVVYMAQNKDMAEKLKSILEEGGILVRINPVSRKEKQMIISKYRYPKRKLQKLMVLS